MRITNKHKLPQPFVDAVLNDPYSKGDAEFSVTELIRPVQMRAISKRFWNHPDMTEDVADRMWSLFGRGVHSILEHSKSEGHLQERRIFATVAGVKISGAFDLYTPTNRIQDYKVTSTYALRAGMKHDWIAQLSMLAWLFWQDTGTQVAGADIVAVLRDWRKRDAIRSKDYPQAQVVVAEVPLWSLAETDAYITRRIHAHKAAEMEALESLPPCTEEERWHKPDRWALTKPGAQRAYKLLPSEDEAQALSGRLAMEGKQYDVQLRQGEDTRCFSYCLARRWCKQFEANWPVDQKETAAVADAKGGG